MALTLQTLVSAVNKEPETLAEQMNIETDSIIVNQIIGDDVPEGLKKSCPSENTFNYRGKTIKVFFRREKGVGLSRNTALDSADHDIVQFADDDIVYDTGYGKTILDEFYSHPEADVLLFNVKAQEGRETYWNDDYAAVNWKNYGRYPAYAICARRERLLKSNVRYSHLFGGGAPYMNGEDSLFLHDCLRAGLSIYRTPAAIGHEVSGESTWFRGYTDKFFFDRGVLYHFLYGRMAAALGFRFLYKNRRTMCADMGILRCYSLLVGGIKHAKKLKKE